jgi:MinD superfamily P-loop ATPase
VGEMPVVDREKCDGCGLCVGVCHCGAVRLADKTIMIIETVQCDWCTDCEAVCPTGAISCPFDISIEEH